MRAARGREARRGPVGAAPEGPPRRRAGRRAGAILARPADAPVLPDRFLDRLARIVPPDRLHAVAATFGAPLATGFRVCTLLAGEAETVAALRAEGVEPEPLAGVPGGYAVPPAQRAALLASAPYAAGHVYVQNPSSQLPPHLLGARPGERVLDLCAAPGSKTGQLAALMGDRGEVVAVEKVRPRFERLRRNVAAQGATCVRPLHGSGAATWRFEPEAFDRVLLDAPCSTEGRFRADEPETTRYWSPRKIKEMRAKQRTLLFSAVQSLRAGGTLVYSTCTFAPEENEGVVAKALRTFGDRIELVDAGLGEPLEARAQPGLAGWNDRAFPEAVGRTRRILPDGRFEAFFVARLVKHASTLAPRR